MSSVRCCVSASRRIHLGFVACVLAPGCTGTTLDVGRELVITVSADLSLPDDAIGRIRALELEVSGAESASARFSVEATPAWRTRRLIHRPGIARGELSLRV